MTSRCKGKKKEVYEKCPEKYGIISRGALNRDHCRKKKQASSSASKTVGWRV